MLTCHFLILFIFIHRIHLMGFYFNPTRIVGALPPAVYLRILRSKNFPVPSQPVSFAFLFAQPSICLHNCISSKFYLLSLLSNQYADDRRTPGMRYHSLGARQICLCQGPGSEPRLLGTRCAVETQHWWWRGDLVLFNLPKVYRVHLLLPFFCQNRSVVLLGIRPRRTNLHASVSTRYVRRKPLRMHYSFLTKFVPVILKASFLSLRPSIHWSMQF